MHKVSIANVLVDRLLDTPVLDVHIMDINKRFNIWIGKSEGISIAEVIADFRGDRPNQHDTAVNIITGLNASIERIVINDILEDCFRATINIKRPDGSTLILDARSSDAIAIGLRQNAPIFVSDIVIEKLNNGNGLHDCSSEQNIEGSPNNTPVINKSDESIGEINPNDFL